MKNDIWFKNNPEVITPFIDHSVKKNEKGATVASYGLSPAGYDIRLKEVKEIRLGMEANGETNPKVPHDIRTLDVHETEQGERYVLVRPHTAYFGVTVERIKMPRNVAGFLLIKSTYGRCGVSVINPLIDPGFQGELTVSLVNHSDYYCRIYLDEGFAQFVCYEVGECDLDYGQKGGNFQNSTGVTQGLKK